MPTAFHTHTTSLQRCFANLPTLFLWEVGDSAFEALESCAMRLEGMVRV
jgi:hypothetical protein